MIGQTAGHCQPCPTAMLVLVVKPRTLLALPNSRLLGVLHTAPNPFWVLLEPRYGCAGALLLCG